MKNFFTHIIAIAALFATAQAAAGWEYHLLEDELDGSKEAQAGSQLVKFDDGYRGGRIKYFCDEGNDGLVLKFVHGHVLDSRHAFSTYSYVDIRTAFFDTHDRRQIVDMIFATRNKDTLFYDDEESHLSTEDILRLLAYKKSLLVRLPIWGGSSEDLRFELNGSVNAINQARDECGLPRI